MQSQNCQHTDDDDDDYDYDYEDEIAMCEFGFWSKYPDEITFDHVQKFWSELSPQARKDLLKVDRQSIFEQARKNMYCSGCYGLLFGCYMQIVMHGGSLDLDETNEILYGRRRRRKKNQNDGGFNEDICDPTTHPWGGLTPAKDGSLTVLSCYIDSKSLNALQNVFNSARARERERELLYPDACGGEGRGWVSHGMQGHGKVHVSREICALHTDIISCDALVDFWSALEEGTRRSLLRIKEEDFVGKLMYRFDSKRFCRDCRKNVIREFKELKELKRTKRKPQCTRTYCAPDSIIQYKVSDDSIQADWRQAFSDSSGTYHHFEWAVGSAEGESDILEFQNAGTKKRVNVDGLDLGGLSTCYITVRAWKQDGKCDKLSVKAHALNGRGCVHDRFIFLDGFVSITEGESSRSFFEHAEEAEEEDEDDDVTDKDGHELDEDCSHPQKHAKSPELAREFLLDSAAVIFKEQAEKAFREANARLNAHSVFVCLVVKLLEERVQVACKEIITLEKQAKLLEEEEKEKKEEERKERRRMKEREKKQRRKEKLKGKEKNNDKDADSSNSVSLQQHQVLKNEHSSIDDEENITANSVESFTEVPICRPSSPNMQDPESSLDRHSSAESRDHCHNAVTDPGDNGYAQDEYDYTTSEHSEHSFQGNKIWKDDSFDSVPKWSRSDKQGSAHVNRIAQPVKKSESRIFSNNYEPYSRSVKGLSRQVRNNGTRAQLRNNPIKHGTRKFYPPCSGIGERYIDSCRYRYVTDRGLIGGSKVPTAGTGMEESEELRPDSTSGKVRQVYNGLKSYQSDSLQDTRKKSHGNNISDSVHNNSRDLCHTEMIREPIDLKKKYPRRNSESDMVMLSSPLKEDATEPSVVPSLSINNGFIENDCANASTNTSVKDLSVSVLNGRNFDLSGELQDNGVELSLKACTLNDCPEAAVCSDSDFKNSYLNLRDKGSNPTSSNTQYLGTKTSSDLEQSGNRKTTPCLDRDFPGFRYNEMEGRSVSISGRDTLSNIPFEIGQFNHQVNSLANSKLTSENVAFSSSELHLGLPAAPNQSIPFPSHQALSSVSYYHPSTIIQPTTPANGLMAMPQLNPYIVSTPINYRWNGNSRFYTPYDGAINQSQAQVYPQVSKLNRTQPEKQAHISKPTTNHGVSYQGHNKLQALKPSIPSKDAPNRKNVKESNGGFSLFHHGGPVALSSALKEGKVNELSLNSSAFQGEADHHVCSNNPATMEEYTLFSSTNDFQFLF